MSESPEQGHREADGLPDVPSQSAQRGPDMAPPATGAQGSLGSSGDPAGDAPRATTASGATVAPAAGAPGVDDDQDSPSEAGQAIVADAAVAAPTGEGATLAAMEDARRKPLSAMGRGTLSRRLVLRTTAIVTVIAVVLGIASTIAVRHVLMNNLNTKVNEALVRAQNTSPHDPSSSSSSSSSSSDDQGPGRFGNATRAENNEVVLQKQGSTVTTAQRFVGLTQNTLTSTQQSELAASYSTTSTTIDLDGLGSYRVQGSTAKIPVMVTSSDGTSTVTTITVTTIVGLPMSEVDESVRKLVGAEAGLTLAALAAAMGLSLALVRSSLKPLNRLAATATEVSTLELDKGEVELPTRVPGRDADPNSEVGRVGHAFNHMLNNVEGALAARQHSETKVRQFVADASHELRNPLAAIRGYAELTNRRRGELPADAAYAIDRIQAESNRMSRLVEDMLLLARLDNDPTLELGEVDVVELVLNAVSDAQVAGSTHEWAVELPEVPVVARADALKLHQVVANLLSNARKHTPEGTEVTTGVQVEAGFAVITVTDDGPGIDESVKDHVFERFARADTARAHNKEGSTGLGLAIVAAVMEAHGGSATVDSRPGRTCFTLRVPLA